LLATIIGIFAKDGADTRCSGLLSANGSPIIESLISVAHVMSRLLFGRLTVALALAVSSLLISPIGVKFIAGRESFRVTVLGLCFATFLLVLAIAVAATGRLRQLMFYVLMGMLPLVFLAVAETSTIALNHADRLFGLRTDHSVFYTKRWQGDGIVINNLGLRTQSPQPKRPGEWRIALTGGSVVWGAGVRDEDTIAPQLARALQHHGCKNVSVYNFGMNGAQLNDELALLKRFRETYAIDQVIFYTGGNNVFGAWGPSWNLETGFTRFELFKMWARLVARFNSSATSRMQRSHSLSAQIVAADEYCRAAGLKCDFALAPSLFTRAHPVGTEPALRRWWEAKYPGLVELWSDMYASALGAGPAGHTHDLRNALDTVSSQIFVDSVHINETGNFAIAKRLEPIAARAIPCDSREND
jgi:hypothetical protein